jgi:ketosteroid isomerase-like protein
MTSTTNDILQQEDDLLRAKRGLDIQAIDRIYGDDLLMTGVMGDPTCSKSAILDEIKRGIAERERALTNDQRFEVSIENQDLKVVRHGEAVITNYRFVVDVNGPGLNAQHRYRTTNVWIKREDRWQIVAAHTAFVLDPKQAAMLSSGSAPDRG